MSPKRRVSREELYALVWQKPMSHLAVEYGVSGRGLAKICDRLDIPVPARGYWAKKAAGNAGPVPNLPKRKAKVPESTEIWSTAPSGPPTQAQIEIQRVAENARSVVTKSIETNEGSELHPKVRRWIDDHKKLQRERKREYKKPIRNKRGVRSWSSWSPPLIPDLTKRDEYRFRCTSRLLYAVEAAGGRILETPVTGRLVFEVDGEDVHCALVEKLVRRTSHRKDDEERWTAFPEHHQSDLTSSGLLRVDISNYLTDGRQRRWVETQNRSFVDMLPMAVGEIIAMAPALVERKREMEEQHREYLRKQAENERRMRLREQNLERWAKLQKLASSWEECRRLEAFLVALRGKVGSDSGVTVDGRTVAEWIVWAEEKLAKEDPAQRTAVELVQAFMPSKRYSYGDY